MNLPQYAKSDIIPYERFLEALIEGDRAECSKISNVLFKENLPIQDIYENIIRRALYEIGEQWERGKLSIATEHMATAIAEAIINEFYVQIISGNKINKSVVVGCVENEYHQIGIKMVADTFEINGWNTYFLGANTPTSSLIEFIKQIKPDMIALSLSLYFNLPILDKMLLAIRAEFPQMNILVGGQAFRHGGTEILNQYDHVYYQPDLSGVEMIIKEIEQNG